MVSVRACCEQPSNDAEMRNKRNSLKVVPLGEGKAKYFSIASSAKFALAMVALTTVVVGVLGDDTKAFQNTISRLCSLNTEGQFGSCCSEYDVSSVTLASSPARNCFVKYIGSSAGSILTSLFVYLITKSELIFFSL